MSFISVFDVMGPNMIGPSSSHTAGAARIAFLAQKMIMPPLKKVEFTLYGSFARTYKGHGTDRALLGGIMGFSTDDMRIRNSFDIAREQGIDYSFTPNETETDVHPNTVDIHMVNDQGQEMTVRGESLGGGKVRIGWRKSKNLQNQWRGCGFHRRIQCHHRDPSGYSRCCGLHHQMLK